MGGLAFGLDLGPDAEPPLERRSENGNVTGKVAEFRQKKNWPNTHGGDELIAVTLNHGSGDARFPWTTGILIADQLLLIVIPITSCFSIRAVLVFGTTESNDGCVRAKPGRDTARIFSCTNVWD